MSVYIYYYIYSLCMQVCVCLRLMRYFTSMLRYVINWFKLMRYICATRFLWDFHYLNEEPPKFIHIMAWEEHHPILHHTNFLLRDPAVLSSFRTSSWKQCEVSYQLPGSQTWKNNPAFRGCRHYEIIYIPKTVQ